MEKHYKSIGFGISAIFIIGLIIYTFFYALGVSRVYILSLMVVQFTLLYFLFCLGYGNSKANHVGMLGLFFIFQCFVFLTPITSHVAKTVEDFRVAKFKGIGLANSGLNQVSGVELGLYVSSGDGAFERSTASKVLHTGAYNPNTAKQSSTDNAGRTAFYSYCAVDVGLDYFWIRKLDNGDTLVYCGLNGNLTIPAKANESISITIGKNLRQSLESKPFDKEKCLKYANIAYIYNGTAAWSQVAKSAYSDFLDATCNDELYKDNLSEYEENVHDKLLQYTLKVAEARKAQGVKP